MSRQEQRYSNQQSNSTFQPQNYRQSGFDQVNPGRTEIHSSSAPVSLDAKQPLVGVIDQGFGAGEHGAEVVKTIAESNPQSPAWLGGGVGNGNWANSLNKFVDVAKSLGQRAVANLSFDLTEKHPDGSVTTRSQLTIAEQQALTYAHDNGVLIVASSGNQGGTMSALGQASQQFDNIITVGAADGGDRAHYSSYGTGLDLVAPGNQTGISFTGTSRSAAEVTGTISKMWAANPTLDYRQVTGVLESTATDLQAPGWDVETGAGLLNSAAAINVAKTITPETQQFFGAQLMQQVYGSFNNSPWISRDGLVASERTNREIEGASIQEDERLKANYRKQTQRSVPAGFIGPVAPGIVRQPPKAPPKSMGQPLQRKSWQDRERSYNSADRQEAADIRRQQRAEAVKQQQAKEQAKLAQIAYDSHASTADRQEAADIRRQQKAALTQLAHDPHTSTADRNEARAILHQQDPEVIAAAEKQRRAQEKAALKDIAHDPHASTADRDESRSILKDMEATSASVEPKQSPKSPSPGNKNKSFLENLLMPRTDNRSYPINATPGQRLGQDIVVGAGKAIWDMGAGVVSMVAHPVDTAKGIYIATRPFDYSVPMTPEERLQQQKAIGNAFIKSYKDAVNEGHAGEAGGRIFVDFGSFFIPGVGEATAAAKALGALGKLGKLAKLGKGAKAADEAVDAARAADEVVELGKGAKADGATNGTRGAGQADNPVGNSPTPTGTTHPPKTELPSEPPLAPPPRTKNPPLETTPKPERTPGSKPIDGLPARGSRPRPTSRPGAPYGRFGDTLPEARKVAKPFRGRGKPQGPETDEAIPIVDFGLKQTTNPDGLHLIGEGNIRAHFNVEKVNGNPPPLPEYIGQRRDGKYVAIEVKNSYKDVDVSNAINSFETANRLVSGKYGRYQMGRYELYVPRGFSGFKDKAYSVNNQGKLIDTTNNNRPIRIDGLEIHVIEEGLPPSIDHQQ